MNDDMPLDRQLAGVGIVVGARARLNVFPVGAETRFVDTDDLAAVRAAQPAVRAMPLAPVDLIDPAGMLDMIEDESLDHVIDWAMARDATQSERRVEAVARVLRPGGLLLLPVSDDRFDRIDVEEETIFAGLDRLEGRLLPERGPAMRGQGIRWPLARFTLVIAALAAEHASRFELEQVRRHGLYNLALLRRRRPTPSKDPCLAVCDGHWYVLDGSFLRHVLSMNLLGLLRAANVPVCRISRAEQALFVSGRPFSRNDVNEFLARTDALQ